MTSGEEASPECSNTALAPHTTKGKSTKRSGRAKTADDVVHQDVDWPHFHVYRGQDRQPAEYEQLTVPEFVLGYITSLMYDSNTSAKARKLEHLRELVMDAATYPWSDVRNYHAIVLNQFEMKKLDWGNKDAIQQLRRTYAQIRARGPENGIAVSTAHTQGPPFCLPFQNGRCNKTTDHQTSRGWVQHACAFCLKRTGNAYRHSEHECRRKQAAPKNGSSEEH